MLYLTLTQRLDFTQSYVYTKCSPIGFNAIGATSRAHAFNAKNLKVNKI